MKHDDRLDAWLTALRHEMAQACMARACELPEKVMLGDDLPDDMPPDGGGLGPWRWLGVDGAFCRMQRCLSIRCINVGWIVWGVSDVRLQRKVNDMQSSDAGLLTRNYTYNPLIGCWMSAERAGSWTETGWWAVQGKMCSVGGWKKMYCPGKFLWTTF